MDLILLQPGCPDVIGPNEDSWEDSWEDSSRSPAKDAGDKIPDIGKCIELVSMSQGIKQQITTDVLKSARTSGRPAITDFTCVKYVDKVSVTLYDYCLRAKPLGEGVDQPTKIHIYRNAGDTISNIITMYLRDAIISEIQFQSHPNDMPTEQFKLTFTEILWAYMLKPTDKTAAAKNSAGWSLIHNRSIVEFTK